MDISKLEAPYQITSIDPWLGSHAGDIELRMNRFKEKRWQIAKDAATPDGIRQRSNVLRFSPDRGRMGLQGMDAGSG